MLNNQQGTREIGILVLFYRFLLKVLTSCVSIFQLEYQHDGPELANNVKK